MDIEVGAVRPSPVFVEPKPSLLQTEAAAVTPKEATVSQPLSLAERADKAILGDVAEVVQSQRPAGEQTPLLNEARLALTAIDTPEGLGAKLTYLQGVQKKLEGSPADDPKVKEIKGLVTEIQEQLQGINPLMERNDPNAEPIPVNNAEIINVK